MNFTMRNRGPRIAVVVLVIVAQGIAAWRLWTAEHQQAGSHEAARAFETGTRGAVVELANLRAAQQAYVAAGQGEAFWTARAASLHAALEARIANIRRLVTSPDAGQALATAADLLDTFRKTDEQARDYVRLEQRLLASDLIFGDSAETLAACAAWIDVALSRESSARERLRAHLRMVEAVTVGAAAAVALAGLLLLLPRRRTEPPVETTGAIEPAETAAPSPATAPAPESPPDLSAVAALCNDFSRVGEATALQSLVARVASLLDASGVIVWMADPATHALQPVLSHGYSEQALARIRHLPGDADNATAEAYRTGQTRIVEGHGRTNGAIVTPLVTPAGCVGVLAAEIHSGGETRKANQAVAAIFAAQLASLASSSPGAS